MPRTVMPRSVTFSTTSDVLPIPPDSWGNAVAIQIRLRDVEPPNALPAACTGNFGNNCRWYYTADPGFSPSPSVEPTDAQILRWPIQRSFMGSIDRTGPLRWLGWSCRRRPASLDGFVLSAGRLLSKFE